MFRDPEELETLTHIKTPAPAVQIVSGNMKLGTKSPFHTLPSVFEQHLKNREDLANYSSFLFKNVSGSHLQNLLMLIK